MRGIKVEAKALVALDSRDGALGAGDVERDLGGMRFEREVDVRLFECFENRAKAFRKIGKTFFEIDLVGWRKCVVCVPNARTGETIHHGRIIIFAFAIAPDRGRKDRFMAVVNQVADCLADEVVGDREACQPMAVKQLPKFLAILCITRGLIYIEMIAPAREFQTIVPHLLG